LTESVAPGLLQKLKERAEAATGSYRIIFETLQRRFERDHPDLLLAENWQSFVGAGTLAGCFTLAVSLHFEVPEDLRNQLEINMRERLELLWPGSEVFFEDLARFVSDSLLELKRPERTEMTYVLTAQWLIMRITDGKAIASEEKIVAELAQLLLNESVGFWKTVEDYSGN